METKDIQYFLEAEDKFKKSHPNYGDFFYDEKYGFGEVGQDDRANFLMDKPFAQNSSSIKEPIGNEEKYGLTKAERVLLRMYYSNYSEQFRDDYYYDKRNMPDVIYAMFEGLDNLIKKAPQNKDSILYRFCCHEDPQDFKVGQVVNFQYNLTCTNYNWEQEKDKNVYIITPLKKGYTKAHNLFEIYEHGDEKQVDFLRETSFVVTKIEKTEGSEYKKYYLTELKSE